MPLGVAAALADFGAVSLSQPLIDFVPSWAYRPPPGGGMRRRREEPIVLYRSRCVLTVSALLLVGCGSDSGSTADPDASLPPSSAESSTVASEPIVDTVPPAIEASTVPLRFRQSNPSRLRMPAPSVSTWPVSQTG